MLLTILYIFCATDEHEQVYGQLTASIFELQKHCSMFRLPSVAILGEHQYYKTNTELLTQCGRVTQICVFNYNCAGRVTQICVFNTVKLGTSANSP
jgi:hypothetical protein